VRVACCREPKLRGGRCDNCGQWSEEAELKPVDVLQGNPNRQIIEDIMGMIAENCTCPGECPVHDDPRDKEPFDLESDGVDDLDFGLEEDDG